MTQIKILPKLIQINYFSYVFFTIFTHSIASFTSCTRKISAPFVSAKVFNTVVPFKASFGLIDKRLYIIDFLETPAKIGTSKCWNMFNLLSNSRSEERRVGKESRIWK